LAPQTFSTKLALSVGGFPDWGLAKKPQKKLFPPLGGGPGKKGPDHWPWLGERGGMGLSMAGGTLGLEGQKLGAETWP